MRNDDGLWLIYGLVDPRDGLVYYVGQSSRGLLRPTEHLYPSAIKRQPLRAAWLIAMRTAGVNPVIRILERVTALGLLQAAERKHITRWRKRNPALANYDIKCRTMSAAHRRALSRAATARFEDPAQRAAASKRWRGRTFSDETRAKMSAAQKKRAADPEERRRRSEALTGRPTRPHTEEACLKMARGRGARPFRDQHGTVYQSVRAAARLTGVDSSTLSKVLKGKLRSTHTYVFTYIE